MNDCPNADVRDLLPDLLHHRLDATTRAMVETHVDGCDDCANELALLRQVVALTRRAPRLDLAAIAAAVPAYRQPVRRSWVGWRTAAAITLMVAGGSSALVLRRNVSPVPDTLEMPQAATVTSEPPSATPSANVTGAVTAAPVPAGDMANGAATQERLSPLAVVDPSAKTVASTVTGTERVRVGRELALSSGPLNDLSDRELATLLKEIDAMDAVPSTEVDNSAISPIQPRRSTP